MIEAEKTGDQIATQVGRYLRHSLVALACLLRMAQPAADSLPSATLAAEIEARLLAARDERRGTYAVRTEHVDADGRPRYVNRLILEDSPYLLQHAHNPVNWYPWNKAAFAAAHREDKPVFLSIGYSTCHWCHVMERESFDDPAVARMLNEHFIAIKVDRERRPDVDTTYMTAVVLFTGQGGWPMSSFLTPVGKTFWGGTYFPRDTFLQLLQEVHASWEQSRDDIVRQADEIALVPNTTTGICLVAEGYPWKDGDNVVLPANEFPTNLYPWLNLESRGVQTRRVPVDGVQVDLDRIAEACDSRTRIISLSWVGYATGWRIDIERLVRMAHDKGILVFLDAIQGLGVFPLDVRRTPVDFLSADGHKWLLGPEGAGIFYVRRDHLDLLRPLGVGWNSVVHRHDFTHLELDVRREAARYEGGTQNTAGFLALGASLELLMRFGTSSDYSAIAERILEITDACCERLKKIGAAVISCRDDHRRSGIVAFEMPEIDPDKVRRRCLEEGVVISNRNGRLRISPHAYTNDEDIDRLVSAIVPLG